MVLTKMPLWLEFRLPLAHFGVLQIVNRHWVAERTHSWMNRFRRLLIRWEKRIENDIGMLHLACAHLACVLAPFL